MPKDDGMLGFIKKLRIYPTGQQPAKADDKKEERYLQAAYTKEMLDRLQEVGRLDLEKAKARGAYPK